MQWLYIGLVAIVVLGVVVLSFAYSRKRRAMRDRAAQYAGHPPGSGDVYDEVILEGIKRELQQLVDELNAMRLWCLGDDTDNLLDPRILRSYLAGHLNVEMRRLHGEDIDELCARVSRLANKGGTNVLIMHTANIWTHKVRRWQEVVWWLAPSLGHIAEQQAIEA